MFTMPSLATIDYGPSAVSETLVAPRPSSTAAPGIFSRLIGYGMRPWRRRSLQRACAVARLALGERMFAAGIDDGELGAQIALLDDKIRRAEAVTASAKAWRAERTQLLMGLAAAALEDNAPLPGADDEYENAR